MSRGRCGEGGILDGRSGVSGCWDVGGIRGKSDQVSFIPTLC